MINTLTSLRLIFALMVFGAHRYVIAPFFDYWQFCWMASVPVLLGITLLLSLLSYYHFEKPMNKLIKGILNNESNGTTFIENASH